MVVNSIVRTLILSIVIFAPARSFPPLPRPLLAMLGRRELGPRLGPAV